MREKDRGKEKSKEERKTEGGEPAAGRKKEEEERTREEGGRPGLHPPSAPREERGAREPDSVAPASRPLTPARREKEPDRGSAHAPPRPERDEAREAGAHRHKPAHVKKERSGHREGKDANPPKEEGGGGKLTTAAKHTPTHAKKEKEGKRERDISHKEERKKPAPPEHKPPRTLITFDLFKPMEALQPPFSERPRPHQQHSEPRGSGSKPGSESRTIAPSRGPKVKDTMHSSSKPVVQDSRPQHSLKHPLKPHTPQTQKDFLI